MSPDHDDDHSVDALEELFEALDSLADPKIPMPVRLWVAGLHVAGVPDDSAAPSSPPLLACAVTKRVSPVRLCGYDINGHGDRAHAPRAERCPPCRRAATHVIPYWEDDFDHLYLCALHVRALIKRNPNEQIEWRRMRNPELDAHVESHTSPSKISQQKKSVRRARQNHARRRSRRS